MRKVGRKGPYLIYMPCLKTGGVIRAVESLLLYHKTLVCKNAPYSAF